VMLGPMKASPPGDVKQLHRQIRQNLFEVFASNAAAAVAGEAAAAQEQASELKEGAAASCSSSSSSESEPAAAAAAAVDGNDAVDDDDVTEPDDAEAGAGDGHQAELWQHGLAGSEGDEELAEGDQEVAAPEQCAAGSTHLCMVRAQPEQRHDSTPKPVSSGSSPHLAC